MVGIILSLKPWWWRMISRGEKTVEIRKTIPHAGMPFKVFVYETKHQGRGAIVGEFTVKRFWSEYRNKDGGISGLTLAEILDYGNGKAYGWEISDVMAYANPINLQEFGLVRPPQSWCYSKSGGKTN